MSTPTIEQVIQVIANNDKNASEIAAALGLAGKPGISTVNSLLFRARPLMSGLSMIETSGAPRWIYRASVAPRPVISSSEPPTVVLVDYFTCPTFLPHIGKYPGAQIYHFIPSHQRVATTEGITNYHPIQFDATIAYALVWHANTHVIGGEKNIKIISNDKRLAEAMAVLSENGITIEVSTTP